MMPDICFMVFAHVRHIHQNFGTRTWSHTAMDMYKNGRGQSGHKTLKLTLSQEWIDEMNWFFLCFCKFSKAKIYFNYFGVGKFRNGHGHLVHETLKFAVSKEWIYEFSWFFACWLWFINFWLRQYRSLYLELFNASLLQLYLLDP